MSVKFCICFLGNCWCCCCCCKCCSCSRCCCCRCWHCQCFICCCINTMSTVQPIKATHAIHIVLLTFFCWCHCVLLAGRGMTGGEEYLSRFTNAPLAHTRTHTHTLQPSARSVTVNVSIWSMRFTCFLIHFISLCLFYPYTHLFLFLSFSCVFLPFSFSARNLLLCCSVTGAIMSGVARYDCMTWVINSLYCIQTLFFIFVLSYWHI